MSVYGLKVEFVVGGLGGEQTLASLAVAFERAGAEVRNFGRYVFPRLVTVLEEAERLQFAAQGQGPIAGRWADLSVAYREWKERAFPGKPILERSGKLKAALTGPGPNSERFITDSTFSFGTIGVPWASWVQSGTPRMTARPPFDFGPEVEKQFRQAAQRGLIDAIRAAKLEAIETEN